MKHALLLMLLLAAVVCLSSCKKDKLVIDNEKEFTQVDFKSTGPYDGGWRLTLKPDGIADLLPGGDIVYRGTYKISGSSLKVKANDTSYDFEIMSETDIKEKKYGTVLRWKQSGE